MDDVVEEFLVESHENLDQLDQDLVTLEADAANPEILSRIFRTIHTLKGSCGFLGFTRLESVSHVGENLLSRLRDGALQLNAEITTALLSLVDAVRHMLVTIETTGHEGEVDYGHLMAILTRLQEGSGGAPEGTPAAATEAPLGSPAKEEDVVATTALADPKPSQEGRGDSPPGGLDQRVEAFLMESYEHVDQLDQDLVTLEAGPADAEMLSRIFGTMHTLKSSCGFLGFTRLESVGHMGENLLSRLRDGALQLNAEITTTLLSLVDAVRQTLATIETTGHEGEADYTPLMASLTRLQEGPRVATEESPAAATEAPAVSPARDEDVAATAACADPEPPQEGQGILLPGAVQAPMVAGLAPPQPAARAPSVADTSIRVDVGLLDMLMDQVGELVLARNRIMQFATDQEDRTLLTAYQRLDTITSELQAGVMKTRMQPIGTIWNKFPRVVRDLARECGKQVTLTMDGQETELDRTLIEAIRDPLTHLVRNAVDHGIERPETRLQAGKPEAGTLLLRAFHEGGQVNIEISDDGAGIDPERIARKATERKLITTQQATQMSPREILHLIFAPGFSTAETVTNVSGRGVGMDVVKSNIERINGTIDVQSQVGKWTAIKIKIPLTLAIIPALMVRCARDRYAIPQVSLVELVRLEGEAAYTKIEIIHGAPVYRLRGNLLPLVYLRRELMVDKGPSNGSGDADDHTVNIVVLQADERQFGLVVDSVHDTEEIVVKPLSKQLKDLAVYAGATIMGDGRVALILDVLGLAQRAHVLSERREAIQMDALTQAQGPLHEVQTL
ncbi:MAG: chemotaxis protein CheA, partial [Candidatus Tectomicrobia bacterium]